MSVLPWGLLPDSSEVGDTGQLLVGGCDLAELAEEYGTPLFVYDEAQLRARCAEAVAAFLAVLELAKLQLVRLLQSSNGNILLYRTTRELLAEDLEAIQR